MVADASLDDMRRIINAAYRQDEEALAAQLIAQLSDVPDTLRKQIELDARNYVLAVRKNLSAIPRVNNFLLEFGLGNDEGLALMCLAEALLRIPDEKTADVFIREQLSRGDWAKYIERSDGSVFMSLATWGLVLLKRVSGSSTHIEDSWRNMLSRLGEPMVRSALKHAVGLVGNVFVLGETIESALESARPYLEKGYNMSFDMLGEGAKTASDAQHYFDAYYHAVRRVGAASYGKGWAQGHGISVKLSALHPRFEWSQADRVQREVVPLLYDLAVLCKQQNISLVVDAEESDRLDIMLDVFCAVRRQPSLQGWDGLGLAVQAYQKRSSAVIDYLATLAKDCRSQIMVRLVKGAYWDAEVKRCQELGLSDYPVFTRKATTDVSYLVCANKLFNSDGLLYPAFATHNAHTIAHILRLPKSNNLPFEFQRLHGMGEDLYDYLLAQGEVKACRIYAPVGGHRSLLAYLVRRILENGANSSFVHRLADKRFEAEQIVADPVELLTQRGSPLRNTHLAMPRMMYADRVNSCGMDLSDYTVRERLKEGVSSFSPVHAHSWVGGKVWRDGDEIKLLCPAETQRELGSWISCNSMGVEWALTVAARSVDAWRARPVDDRAKCLERFADLLEEALPRFVALAVLEAGKTYANAVAEVREAVDFARYYAQQARCLMSQAMDLPGPVGEKNTLQLLGKGVFVCISPWNFPLAIFSGQVLAALVTGNTVIAKPAEQTPLMAFEAVTLLYEAGVPKEVLHLVLGDGASVGARLVCDSRVDGVMFTGSNETASAISRALAERPGPIATLIAETGGINAMLVDSTALPEQVVSDVILSAFDSAGQRCSALRLLCLQEDIAPRVLEILSGAINEIRVGDPAEFFNDIGPVIDEEARARLEDHCAKMAKHGRLIAHAKRSEGAHNGYYVEPRLILLDDVSMLKQETFGPILHVVTFKAHEMDDLIAKINGLGYGLTFGIHSRIDDTVKRVSEKIRAGNIYVNRNMVGAVVGSQPFGGMGLSGTGPKAGGPHYLLRLVNEKVVCTNLSAVGGNASLLMGGDET